MNITKRTAVLLSSLLAWVVIRSIFLVSRGADVRGIFLLQLPELILLAASFLLVFRPLRLLGSVLNRLLRGGKLEEISQMSTQLPYEKELRALFERVVSDTTRSSSAQILDKQTELTALQSQINPHFLYNTLESIRGQALLDDNMEIAKMVEALAAFFRYSISRHQSNLVTLRDELANIRNYMLIQRYRFNNRFSLEVIIDEEDEAAYDYLIPRLIIQPVIENAIFHGFEDMLENGKITIEVMLTETTMILVISDNGKGIDGKTLQKLNDKIHSPQMDLDEETPGSSRQRNTGIALPNIHKRIQLLFGPEYGVNVYSTVGQGTDVEIIMPADFKVEEQQKTGRGAGSE